MRSVIVAVTLITLASVGVLWSQEAIGPAAPSDDGLVWICPMDPDVRSHDPGTCPRCGMKLASGLPEPTEYHLNIGLSPRLIEPGKPMNLVFEIHDPWKDRPVTKFQVVHEKLFHMFVIGQDLDFFLHDHPVFSPDGNFHFDNLVVPKPGMYRVLGDFYPDGATPQLIAKTLIVPGEPLPAPVSLTPDYAPKDAENLHVEFHTVPEVPIAGMTTQLHFKLSPAEGIEKYLAAWGHMLVASDDLIDLIHTHPFIADGGPEVQFNVVFPRPGRHYRVWVQFQREGVVNTAKFDVKAEDLR
jgi:hypothetical protein